MATAVTFRANIDSTSQCRLIGRMSDNSDKYLFLARQVYQADEETVP